MDVGKIGNARADISELMSKIKQVSNNSKIFKTEHVNPTEGGFENVLSMAKSAITEVNQLQNTSTNLKDAYLAGQANVSMSQVIVASEKSKIAFEGLMAVRHKILEAYKEIMSMQV